jgi:hypothetical protein
MGIIVNEETEECVVELYLKPMLVLPLQNNMFRFDAPKTILISRRETLFELEKKICRVFNNSLFSRGEKNFLVTKFRLWKALLSQTKVEELAEIEKKVKSYTHVKFDGRCLNA